jgi:tetrahydromethanopterin S-methyltransferase subunit H
MLRFVNKQSSFGIGGMTFGGQPGMRKTVMVGSLFYPRHSIVEDRVAGRVRPGAVEKLLSDLHAASEETGVPAAVMVYAETPKAMQNHLSSVVDRTDLPLFIDSPSAEVRIAGALRAQEMGVAHRVVYNTLNAGATELELTSLQESGIRSAVLLAFNPSDIQAKGKIYLLEDGGGILPEGLLNLAQRHGIDQPLLDLAVMGSEQNAGAALRAIMIAKAKWGFPCGCAMHNAVESYAPLLKLTAEDRKLFRYVDVASAIMPIMAGADFVMYGPLESARRIFHASAFADQMMAQAASEL